MQVITELVLLSQVNDDKSECVVAYASRSLTRQEQRYCVTRRELLAIVEFTQHFRQYLLGREFTLRTDHGSLVWIQNFKEPEGQVARWLERLAEYNFKVVHRRGTKHNNADALSRLPCKQCGRSNHLQGDMVVDEPVLLVRPFQTHSTGEIYQLQIKDLAIRPVYVAVKKGKLPHDDEISVLGRESKILLQQWESLFIKNGVLLRKGIEGSNVPQLIVPSSLYRTVLKELHEGAVGGHLGEGKMLGRLKERFY